MAAFWDDDPPDFAETLGERSARYWKRAASMYRHACNSESTEVRALYMDVAKAWAGLAAELERTAEAPATVKQRDDRPAR